jgi:hypothetical protein
MNRGWGTGLSIWIEYWHNLDTEFTPNAYLIVEIFIEIGLD